jgi:hypothetical protein
MSMFVSVVRVTPTAFAAIQKQPDQLEGVFFDEDAAVMQRLGIGDADSAGFDYRIADEMMDAMDDGEDEGEGGGGGDSVLRDLGADGELDYDAGYGNAFTLSPAAVARAATNSAVIGLDDEVDALFASAAERGDYIIGIIS